jgi:WD40 repeat protein
VPGGENKAVLSRQLLLPTCVALSPDGKTLVTASLDGNGRLWDTEAGTISAMLNRDRTGNCYSAVFTPDSKTLILGSYDKTVQLWDVAKKEPISEFAGHTKFIHSVAISPNGKIIASGSDDRTVKLWDMKRARNWPR